MAKCPNCDADVRWDAPSCGACGAAFGTNAAWRPIPTNGAEAAQLGASYDVATPEPAAAAPVIEKPDAAATAANGPSGLPFHAFWPIVAGALVGVALRVAFFGQPGRAYAAMMVSFIFLAPMVVGAVTVYLAERIRRRSSWYYLWAPFTANLLFVGGTLMIMVEGWICAIVIFPLFAAVGMVGGVIMGIVCRTTNWPRHALYSLAALPFVLGGLEGNMETPSRFGAVQRVVVIPAEPEVVWRQIMDAREIRPDEMDRAWIFRIGVPLPLAGVVEPSPDGPVRKIRMGKDVHFDQVFTERQENRYAHWTYKLYPDSFPPYALDDHVVVGGYYFDVRDTSYTLTPISEGTELRINMGYRVTTQFNWYAEPLARYLLGNFEEVVLKFYRRRSEAING